MKLFIHSTNKKTHDGRKFKSYWTYMMLTVRGEEAKGKQRKSVNVKFANGVDASKITRGVIEGDFDAPFVFEVTKDEKTGKDRYPTVWVNRIDSFTEVRPQHQQSDFILDEEVDSEETEIAADPNKSDLPF